MVSIRKLVVYQYCWQYCWLNKLQEFCAVWGAEFFLITFGTASIDA